MLHNIPYLYFSMAGVLDYISHFAQCSGYPLKTVLKQTQELYPLLTFLSALHTHRSCSHGKHLSQLECVDSGYKTEQIITN